MRPPKPFGTRDVSGEKSATIAAQPSRPVQDMVRTLTAIGYITVAVSTGDPKPAIMETIPVMNMQVISDLPCVKNTLPPSIRSIRIAWIAILPTVR